MKLIELVHALENKYTYNNVDFLLSQDAHNFLTPSIIPSSHFVMKAQGSTLVADNGPIIDICSMTVNTILGQNDFWVNANIIAYILSDRPSFLSTRLGSEYYYKVAKKISKIGGLDDARVNHRQCNGSDVVELAVKSAYYNRTDTSKHVIISFSGSYHGQNLTSYIVSDRQKKYNFVAESSSHCIFVDAPSYCSDINNPVLTAHDEKILSHIEKYSDKAYAIIIEPIQMNNEVNVVSPFFLAKLRELCNRKNICLIFDEVQTACGWLGKMSAAELFNIKPDIIVLGKALTAGYGPLATLVSTRKYAHIPYGTGEKTNGADVRSLVATHAVLDRLYGLENQDIPNHISELWYAKLSQGLLSSVDQKSELLTFLLERLRKESEGLISRIKGLKMIRGLEIVDGDGKPNAKMAKKICSMLLDNGVFCRSNDSVIIVKPALTISYSELYVAMEKIKKIIQFLKNK